MPNYQNGKIYKLVNSVDDQIYIGSTTQSLAKRKWGHKSKSKKRQTQKVYSHLNSIGWRNVKIVLIENVQAFSKDQLRMREDHYINLLKPTLNSYPAIANCPHNRRQRECKGCGGSQICQHQRIRRMCKDCSPSYCFECDLTFGGNHKLTQHCRTQKHKTECKRQFLEVFGEILSDSEIPMY